MDRYEKLRRLSIVDGTASSYALSSSQARANSLAGQFGT